jgi:hypothetical protein
MYQSKKLELFNHKKLSYVRIQQHKYTNLDLFDQKKKKHSIPGDDGILIKNTYKSLMLKTFKNFFSGD